LTQFWRHSLSQRLLAGLLVVSFLYWIVIVAASIRDNLTEVHELYDIHLTHTALSLLRLNNPITANSSLVTGNEAAQAIERIFQNWPDLPERVLQIPADRVAHSGPVPLLVDKEVVAKNIEYGKSLRYQIWSKNDRLMFQSANAPAYPITESLGLSDSKDVQGKIWRHYSIWDRNHDARVIVSEPHDIRSQLIQSLAISAISPVVLGMPVLILLLWLSIKKGLEPLTELSREIATRKSGSLTLFDEENAPRELRPIVLALNELLQRMGQTLENERRFNDNAAHELRTPLAAIQAHLYAAHSAGSETERQLSLEQAQRGVDRGIRLVSQMLTLARLEPTQDLPNLVPVNLNEIAQSVCAELAPLALQRGQTLELLAEPVQPTLKGNADLLSRLLGNLIDNAIRYTPQDGHICIKVNQCDAGLQMSVCDDGPGIAPAQRDKVFNRFYRLADQSQPGTGLGLAICRSIADLHRAQISLSSDQQGRGLTVHVTFAIPPEQTA
jgi:two-component system sensor histidine kinase QseC